MAGNTFGKLFRITTFGESHGPALGVIVDGCPAGLELDTEHIAAELRRRRPGQSKLVTPRGEKDECEILSGVFEGKTTGTPITAIIRNEDVKSKDYSAIKDLFRPGHADFTYHAKYGHRDYRGGGRSSARETAARVIGGAIAKQLLAKAGVEFKGALVQVGSVVAKERNWDLVDQNDLKTCDASVVDAMTKEIEGARKDRDSIGGVVEVQALNVPVGLGEPIFEKLDAAIASAMMSIPAVRAVELGDGFQCPTMRGSEMNDEMSPEGFLSNSHGGTLGGLSSGAPIISRIYIKPTSSIPQKKKTIDVNLKEGEISTLGRHDPCVAIRAVPIAEAMLALVLVDYWLQDLACRGAAEHYSPINSIKYGLADE